MIKTILLALFLSIILVDTSYASEDLTLNYPLYMDEFKRNQNIATKILLDAENALKDGNKQLACTKQKEASRYGILASEALINALDAFGSDIGIDNIKSNLVRWKRLSNSC